MCRDRLRNSLVVIRDILSPSSMMQQGRLRSMLLEKEMGYNIKALKYDIDGEYTSKEFAEYLSREGIHGLKTISRILQQNGVVERMNKTILEHARCMRLHAGLSLHLQATTVDAVVYLINISSFSELDGEIP